MQPNSFLIIISPGQEANVGNGPADYSDSGVSVASNIRNRRFISFKSNDSGFAVYQGDRLQETPSYLEDKWRKGWDASVDNGVFIRYDKYSERLTIESDFLGTEIIYYTRAEGRVFLSNRIENIQEHASLSPDFTGVRQFLQGAQTVAGRTCLKGLMKTRALRKVSVDTGSLTVSDAPNGAWVVDRDLAPDPERLTDLWRGLLDKAPPSVIMLSAGWDSRMLLSSNIERIVATYSHGDLESREIRLVYRLACSRAPTLIFKHLRTAAYQYDVIARMLDELGHALFPHWYFAAEWCAQFTDAPIVGGIYAEHLSGQYGLTSLGSVGTKALNLLKGFFSPGRLSFLSEEEVRDSALRILDSPMRNPWFLNDQWNDIAREADEENREDIVRTLSEYQAEGTTGLQEVFERYRLEQTQRQYYALQTRCGIPFNGFSHPFADSSLSKASIEIPYEHRIQYKMSREILARLDPTLLEFPLAATLVKAKAPVIVQEASRGARIGLQSLERALLGRRRVRLGWNDFQFLLNSGVFEGYLETLKADLWDKKKMRSFVEGYSSRGGDAYSLLDMFGKILTVDHLIG